VSYLASRTILLLRTCPQSVNIFFVARVPHCNNIFIARKPTRALVALKFGKKFTGKTFFAAQYGNVAFALQAGHPVNIGFN